MLFRVNSVIEDVKLPFQITNEQFADFAGFITYNKKGEECFSFGKHKNKRVIDVMENETGYFGWLLNADFPLYTKKVLTAIKLRNFNNNPVARSLCTYHCPIIAITFYHTQEVPSHIRSKSD